MYHETIPELVKQVCRIRNYSNFYAVDGVLYD
jgi:hypothetical protein